MRWTWVCDDSLAVCATRNGYNSYHQYSQPLGLVLYLLNLTVWNFKNGPRIVRFLDLILDMFDVGIDGVIHQWHALSYMNSPEQSRQRTRTSFQSQWVGSMLGNKEAGKATRMKPPYIPHLRSSFKTSIKYTIGVNKNHIMHRMLFLTYNNYMHDYIVFFFHRTGYTH